MRHGAQFEVHDYGDELGRYARLRRRGNSRNGGFMERMAFCGVGGGADGGEDAFGVVARGGEGEGVVGAMGLFM